jgi:rod shape determining protein RodA
MSESRAARDAVKSPSRAFSHHPLPTDSEIITRKPAYTIALLVASGFLLVCGAFNMYSASAGGDLFWAHMKHMSVGLTAFALLAFVMRPRHFNASAYWVYGAICLALIAVLVMGQIGGGSRRWLTFGSFTGQPSELAKIAIAMVTARFFAEVKLNGAYRLRDLWPLLALVGFASLLIFPQPDLGTATFLVLIVAAQLCFVQLDGRSVMVVLGSAAVALPLAWHFLLLDYQKIRILSFLDPAYEPQGKGYNVLQSLVAIGSGGLHGKGFMNGTQTHLKFLPMSHSDFIFSVFAEEHGFIGGSLVLLSFFTIGVVSLLIARACKNTFSAILAVGLGAFLFIEFAINVAMVLRMFPVKGLPLPFLSAGGSNLIVSCAAVGILIAIDRDNRGRFRGRHLNMYKA